MSSVQPIESMKISVQSAITIWCQFDKLGKNKQMYLSVISWNEAAPREVELQILQTEVNSSAKSYGYYA